ncbi:LysE family translocator [Luteimonas deserti]|nr:LysE family translocator [Luteimonas deserti]
MDGWGFALAVLLVEITPGPNMAWLVSLTLAEGRRAGLMATAGIAIGLALNAALSGIGLSALLVKVPVVGAWIGIGAGLMMLWLAWRGWRDAGGAMEAAQGRTLLQLTGAGIVLNLLNAKAAVFFLTVVPRFLSGPDAPFREIIALGAISVGVATLVHLGLVLGAARLRRIVTRPDRVRPVRRVLALGMVAVGGWFFYTALR